MRPHLCAWVANICTLWRAVSPRGCRDSPFENCPRVTRDISCDDKHLCILYSYSLWRLECTKSVANGCENVNIAPSRLEWQSKINKNKTRVFPTDFVFWSRPALEFEHIFCHRTRFLWLRAGNSQTDSSGILCVIRPVRVQNLAGHALRLGWVALCKRTISCENQE